VVSGLPRANFAVSKVSRVGYSENSANPFWEKFLTAPLGCGGRRGLGGGIPPHPRIGKIRADNWKRKCWNCPSSEGFFVFVATLTIQSFYAIILPAWDGLKCSLKIQPLKPLNGERSS